MFKNVLMLSLILIMSTVYLVPTYALDFDEPADEPVITEFQHMNSIKTSLSISGGNAYVGVTVTGIINHTTKISVAVTLQKKSGGKWTNVATWHQTSDGYLLRLNKTKAVSKGTYRIKNVVTAYKNASNETKTDYSAPKTCS